MKVCKLKFIIGAIILFVFSLLLILVQILPQQGIYTAFADSKTGDFGTITLSQDAYSESGDKGANASLGGAKSGDHYTYDGHIHFQWVSHVWFGIGYDGDDWCRGRVSGISGKISGAMDDCKFTFTVSKTGTTDNIDTGSSWGSGLGQIKAYKNGTLVKTVGENGNIAMNSSTEKYVNCSLGAIDFEDTYELVCTIQFKWRHGDEWATYEGSWTYKFKAERVLEHNETFSVSPYAEQDGIKYFNQDFNLSWSNDYSTNKTTNSGIDVVKVQPKAYGKRNDLDYTSATSVSSDGRHTFKLYYYKTSSSTNTFSTITTILDKTAPQPTFSQASVSNIYPKGTAVSYSYNSYSESPITSATYSRRDVVFTESEFSVGDERETDISFTSGKTFSEMGLYTVKITDLCGNTSTTDFMVVSIDLNFNFNRVKTTGYLKTDNYRVRIPYLKNVTIGETGKDGQVSKYEGSFSNAQMYIFANYENAVRFMSEIELQEAVTVVGENSFRYKQKNNANATATYNREELWEVLNWYAKKYVSACGETAVNSAVYVDKNTVIMDTEVLSIETKYGEFFIDNSFVFSNFSKEITYNNKKYIYTTTARLNITNGGDTLFSGNLMTGKTLGEYIENYSGVICITESDLLGNSYTFTAVYDTVAPSIDAEYERYEIYADEDGETQNRILASTVTISSGLEIDTNLKSFSITGVNDIYDDIIFVQVMLPNGNTVVTRDLTTLQFGVAGFYADGGEYRVKIYDRSLNVFEYVFSIAGSVPKVSNYTNNAGDKRTITISFTNGSNYSSITHFTIYRYGVALPEAGVYKEYVDEVLMNSVLISQDVWTYTFYKGGIYTIKFVDSFNRVIWSDEIVFKKGLPTYTLTGVTENEKTKKAVTILFDDTVGFELTLNGMPVAGVGGTVSDGYKIEIPASVEYNGKFFVKLYKKSDEMSYLTFTFIMDTIPPIAKIYTGDNVSLIWGQYVNTPFKVTWDTAENVERVRYTIDDGYFKAYEKNTVLTENGKYTFEVTDDVGNVSTYEMELDTIVKYLLVFGTNNYTENDVLFVRDGFSILSKENNLNLAIFRDDVALLVSKFEETYTSEGRYKIVLTDYIGNTATVFVVIDTTAPNVVITLGADEFDPVTVSLPIADIFSCVLKVNNKTTDKELSDTWIFSDYGSYEITVKDRLNNVQTKTFTINKHVPIITIFDTDNNAVTNGATTNKSVYFVWDDTTATGRIDENGIKKNYTQRTVLSEDAVYTLTVTDEVGQKVSATVTVNKTIKFTFVTADNTKIEIAKVDDKEKTKNQFTITFTGELFVTVQKNGENFAFTVGDIITDDGEYYFHVYDNFGNFEDKTITLDTTAPAISFTRQGDKPTDSVRVDVDTVDAKTVRVTRKSTVTTTTNLAVEEYYQFIDWGEYTVVTSDFLGNSATITFVVQKVPPEVVFQAVSGAILEDGHFYNEAFFLDYTENLLVKYHINNGFNVVYSKGVILTEQGNYAFTITDEADNVYQFGVSIDCSLDFGVVVDGQNVKDFSDSVVGKRYIEITLREALTVRMTVAGETTEITEQVFRFTQEGVYQFVFTDRVFNTQTVVLEIDNTAPVCYIDTDTYTKSDVVLFVDDVNDVALYSVVKDGSSVKKFVLHKTNVFTEEGRYTVTVQDELANKKIIDFIIKRKINFTASVSDGFVTSGAVSFTLKEDGLSVSATRNNEQVEVSNTATFEFKEAGEYVVILTDVIGNKRTLKFTIEATKFRRDFSFTIPVDSEIVLTKNGVKIDVDGLIVEDVLRVTDDGEYVLTLKKDGVYSTYDFVIDNVVPTLKVNGVEYKAGENIGSFREDIFIESTKKNSTVTVYFNGEIVEYNESKGLSMPGSYKVVITDEIGNEIVYEFEREFTLNSFAVVLICVVIVLIVVAIILILRYRRKNRITNI